MAVHIDYGSVYSDLEDIDNIILEENPRKNRREKLLDDIRDIEEGSYESDFFPSDIIKDTREKVHKEDDVDTSELESWLNDIAIFSTPPKKINANKAISNMFGDNIFEPKKKKKKKKDKDKNEPVNYKKEFAPEMNLYKNLLVDQSKFTADLQKTYDSIMTKRSSYAGVNKQITDLIDNINSARTLSMQLVEKNVNAKKLIAELELKQNKELGILDTENMGEFASSYMKKLIDNRKSFFNDSPGDVSDYDENELFVDINENLGEGRLDDEASKFIQYESRDVKIYVVIQGTDTSNYEFVAKAADGEIIEDYPLPFKSKIVVNESTNIAIDEYGEKYPIIWE